MRSFPIYTNNMNVKKRDNRNKDELLKSVALIDGTINREHLWTNIFLPDIHIHAAFPIARAFQSLIEPLAPIHVPLIFSCNVSTVVTGNQRARDPQSNEPWKMKYISVLPSTSQIDEMDIRV
jgi:hypothetical protein